jgi:hypothetical protein
MKCVLDEYFDVSLTDLQLPLPYAQYTYTKRLRLASGTYNGKEYADALLWLCSKSTDLSETGTNISTEVISWS